MYIFKCECSRVSPSRTPSAQVGIDLRPGFKPDRRIASVHLGGLREKKFSTIGL